MTEIIVAIAPHLAVGITWFGWGYLVGHWRGEARANAHHIHRRIEQDNL